MRDKNRAFRAG